jgi:hypothetical protein
VANSDAGVPDVQPIMADAQTPDAQLPPADTTPCINGEFDLNRNCLIQLDNGQTRNGFVSCRAGAWSTCLDINPPQNSMSCAGWRDGEIDVYSTCIPFPGCYYGSYVCNGTSWQWECRVITDFYTPASCIKLDAGTPDTQPADTHVPVDTMPVDAQVSTDATVLPDVDYSKGWPYINCVNTDATGAYLNITLDGNIDGQGTDGVSNLIDQQSSSYVGPKVICIVGGDGIGWFNRDAQHCVAWTPGMTHVVFPTFPVNTMTLTEINYVIDGGLGYMIWDNNARLLFMTPDRCGEGGSKGNLIIKAVGT